MAALLNLTENEKVWETNVEGTRNVISFATRNNIQQFYFLSTAYSSINGHNLYEKSKAIAEISVENSKIPRVTIIKPSIIIGSKENPGTDQTINRIALTIAKVHARAECARRKFQDALALPPLELGFRLNGNPDSTLNVVTVDVVADEIIKGKEGTFFITNPHPPRLQEVADEIGEALKLNIRILMEFKPSPPERLLSSLIKPFLPYMQGEPSFPTVLDKSYKLPKGYIRDMVRAFLLTT